jgi:flagellar basal-body rod protein FlgG
MLAAQTQSEVIADNIANLRTTGYKEEFSTLLAFPTLPIQRNQLIASTIPESVRIGNMGTGVMVDRITKIGDQGSLQETGEKTDIALAGQGFFVVQTPNGERYTRNGQFQIREGVLQTAEGYPVLGQNGAVQLNGSPFIIDGDGRIVEDGDPGRVQQLRFVTIEPDLLQREGQSLYTSPGQPAQEMIPGTVQVQQGFLEGSNVDLAGQMVKMIKIMRVYEANQRLIQTEDATLDKAVNEIGKI